MRQHLSLLYGFVLTGLGLLAILFLVDLGDHTQAVSPLTSVGGAPRSPASDPSAASATAAWPQAPRTVVLAMAERYGEPDATSDDSVVWSRRGRWERIVVWREPPVSGRGARRGDFLQQTVSYRVPQDRLKEFSRSGIRVAADPVRGELSARASSEKLNTVALNLADEVLANGMDAGTARRIYERAARLTRAGKSSAYAESLRFQPVPESSGPGGGQGG